MNDQGIAELGAILRRYAALPYEQAWSMPKQFYTDPRLLDLEKEWLFLEQWVCVGRTEELSRPGDFVAFQICDEPIVVIHGEDGTIRAFSNVCRHRGTVIAKGRGNSRRLLCPYHSWSYDTHGRLIGATAIGERSGFERATCRLPEFACTLWHGFVFMCLADDPPSFGPQLSGLEALIKPYHMGITDYGHRGVPNVFLSAPLTSDGTWNAAHFKNAEYDALVKGYIGSLDLESQRTAAGKIQRLLLDETPLIFAYFYDFLTAAKKGATGIQPTAMRPGCSLVPRQALSRRPNERCQPRAVPIRSSTCSTAGRQSSEP